MDPIVFNTQVEVLFSTTSSTGFVTHYYLKSAFPAPVSDISHSVGERNVVLTINKCSCVQWEIFSAQSASEDMPAQVSFSYTTVYF